MKILIVAYDVAPLELVSSQRVNHFIEFFSKKGYEVDVLTSKKRNIDGPILDEQKYLYLKDIANFIELPSTFLNKKVKGGIQNISDVKSGESKLRSVLKKIRSLLVMCFGQLFDYRTIWAYRAVKYLKSHSNHYDVILTSSLPASVVWVGNVAKKNNLHSLWIADFRDLWSLNNLANYSWFSRKLDNFLEKKMLRNCDILVTVSEALKEELLTIHSQEVIVVRNGFVLDEYINLQEDHSLFKDPSKINIVYAGNIYKDKRDPTELIKYISNNNLSEKVNIYFFGYYMENLKTIIDENEANSYVFIMGSLPRKRMLEVLKSADINLFLESGEDKNKGNVSGKIFELIAIGKPIISIGPKNYFESTQIINEANLLFDKSDLLLFEKNNISKNGLSKVSSLGSRDEQVEKLYSLIVSRQK